MTRNEHEIEDQRADLLEDILGKTRGEKGSSLGVPHQRRGTRNNRDGYQLNIESSCTVLCCCRLRTNQRTRANHGQSLGMCTAEMKSSELKKKKVQLQDMGCKGFCCYSAKGKVYRGVSIDSPKQVGMFRVNPPH